MSAYDPKADIRRLGPKPKNRLRSGWRIGGLAMQRREFITLAGSAAYLPLVAHAQSRSRLPTIGIIGAGTQQGWSQWTAAFLQRLRELGWIEGRTVTIEYRWADGRGEREAEIASEFTRLKVDVMLTVGGASAKQATSDIPIVFAISADPVGTGVVASLARPGGNITGLSIQATDLAGKRLELLREALPGVRQLAIMADFRLPAAALELDGFRTAAKALGAIEVSKSEISRAEDIPPAIEALRGRIQALYVPANRLANANRVRINELAIAARIPTMFGFREYVESGGLMSYGPNTQELFRRSADFVDKILRGAKPADMPVEQPTKFDLIVNLKTAKALGIELPPNLLARVDEAIE
jgi:putative ABC transport system substrate-binding protein